MSKPKFRVMISVLLCLAVLVAVFSVAQGAASNAGARSGQPHVDAGLLPDFSRVRSSGQQAPAIEQYYYDDAGKGGGCEHHYNDLDD